MCMQCPELDSRQHSSSLKTKSLSVATAVLNAHARTPEKMVYQEKSLTLVILAVFCCPYQAVR